MKDVEIMRLEFRVGGVLRNAIELLLLICLLSSCGQATSYLDWQKCLGGSNNDEAYSVRQTADGGYVVAGDAKSNDGDVSDNHGQFDCWIVKLNESGNLVWQKCLGGTSEDTAYSIQQTADGGYVVAGETTSNNGNVKGNHGSYDYWAVKLNASGNLDWQKCLGGTGEDTGYSIQQTKDRGYVVAGVTYSNSGDVSGNHGQQDCWLVKLDASGNIKWQKCLGGSGWDGAGSVQQTADGGYIVAGFADSKDGDVRGNHGSYDYWVVKLDGSANLVWQKCLGGSYTDVAWSVQQTADGGYVVAGNTQSKDGDVRGNHGGFDCWLVKLDGSGNLVWQKCLGGSSDDEAYSVRQTIDGGYLVAGHTESMDGDVSGRYGIGHWVVKLDASGNMEWERCLDGSTFDTAYSIQQTADGGYVVAGRTYSFDSDGSGNYDLWVVKLGEINCTITAPDIVYSGSTGNLASTAELGAAYAWSITNGAITSAIDAQSISFTAGTSGTTRLTVNVNRPGSWNECYKDIAIKPKPDSSLTSDLPVRDNPVQQPSGMDFRQSDSGDGQVSSPENKVRIYPG